MRWLLIIVFFAYIYVELYVFIQIAHVTGLLLALFLVIFTSSVGISLVRNQGFSNLAMMQQKIQDGENPAAEIVKSVALMLAGILLIVPGFVTDIIGALLLLPLVQKHLLLKIVSRVRFRHGDWQQNMSHQGHTFEGEYQRKDDDNNLSNPRR